jgi:hypothetical protein
VKRDVENQLVHSPWILLTAELPQFLLSKYQDKGVIGITQPRRVAAINLARRVAEENGTQLRNKVFTISNNSNAGRIFNSIRRFDDKSN